MEGRGIAKPKEKNENLNFFLMAVGAVSVCAEGLSIRAEEVDAKVNGSYMHAIQKNCCYWNCTVRFSLGFTMPLI